MLVTRKSLGRAVAAMLAAAMALACGSTPTKSEPASQGEPEMTFTNPLYPGADPWVVKKGDSYYQCWSANGAILYASEGSDPYDRDRSAPIWLPPRGAWNRADVWAPELHFLEGRWYIYYAADAGQNESHRMGVLRALTDDPLGKWEDLGQLRTGGRWAIDGTVLEHGGMLYFVWSGWPGAVDGRQNLYIAAMSSPEAVSGEPVLLSEPTLPWETKAMPIMEGPQALSKNGTTLIVYSASGSWTRDYCLGGLVLKSGADPLDPASWKKLPEPLFGEDGSVYGPGHASFTVSPDGTEDWILYHAKTGIEHGWDRNIRAQPFSWKDGLPVFGKPVQDGVALPRPAGWKTK